MPQPDRQPSQNVVIEHPNRGKAAVQATRATVVLLMLITVGVMAIITIGGWGALEGAKPLQIAYMIVFLLLAYFAGRWNRGVLPVAAALAVILAIFALVAGPAWFSRDKTGFTSPGLPQGLLGLLTLALIPIQFLLIAFAMRGFSQGWNVEVERPAPGYEGDFGDTAPTPA